MKCETCDGTGGIFDDSFCNNCKGTGIQPEPFVNRTLKEISEWCGKSEQTEDEKIRDAFNRWKKTREKTAHFPEFEECFKAGYKSAQKELKGADLQVTLLRELCLKKDKQITDQVETINRLLEDIR